MEVMEVDNIQQPELISINSREKVYVRFKNCTDRSVGIIWINYVGQYMEYRLLKRDNFIDITTYKSHPWLAIDMDTGDRMHIGDKLVYLPKTWQEVMKEKFPNHHVPYINRRLLVKITLPLYSLKYMTLLVVRNILRRPEDADQLEIPKQLRNILRTFIEQKNSSRFRNTET